MEKNKQTKPRLEQGNLTNLGLASVIENVTERT